MTFASLKLSRVLLLQTLSHFPEEVPCDVHLLTGVGVEPELQGHHGRGEEQEHQDTPPVPVPQQPHCRGPGSTQILVF